MENESKNNEEILNKVISGEEFEEAKKQWLYKTIIWVVGIVIVTALVVSTITYYIAVGKRYDDLYKSTSKVGSGEKTDASSAISDISQILKSFAGVIDLNYIGDIDKATLINSTIKGFVEGIDDEYSEYMTAEEWQKYQETALGNYVGVGIYMTKDADGNITIVRTIKGSPAEEAGLEPEDLIIGVNGESTNGMNTEDVSNKVKGEEGTEVTLNISRNGERMDVKLTRSAIKAYHVETEVLDDNIGYISLSTFDTGCADEFEQGMDELVGKGCKKVIFDLRYNTGGLVSEALEIIDLFVQKGEVTLIEKSADGSEKTCKASGDKKYDVELVVLVNEYTASASEIVTGALSDYEVATTVGTVTYGKGVIQNVYQLTDGSVLKLTTAEYYTPKRNKINKVGITPNHEVKLPTEVSEDGTVQDTQLLKAKELLK